MTEQEISKIVFDCALRVHKALGPGLLESAYEECLYYELKKSNLKVEKQKPLPLIYEEVKLDVGYRIDIIIEDNFFFVIDIFIYNFKDTLRYIKNIVIDCYF
jgi:GxxExxY protein